MYPYTQFLFILYQLFSQIPQCSNRNSLMEYSLNFQDEQQPSLFVQLLRSDSKVKRKTTINSDMIEEEIVLKSLHSESDLSRQENLNDLFFNDVSPIESGPIPEKSNEVPQTTLSTDIEKGSQSKEDEEIPNNKEKASEKEEEHVFRFKNIRKQNKKNTNFPKFLIRIFLKYSSRKSFESPAVFKEFQKNCRSLANRHKNNFNIMDVKKILGLESDTYNPTASLAFRQHMSKLLLKTYKEEIIFNNYVSRNKMEYLTSAKVYALRCRSKKLVERAQTR